MARFHETLRRLAMIDESFVEDRVGLSLDLARTSALDLTTVALLRVGVSVAMGSPGVCVEWSAGRALAAGASEDQIADVLGQAHPGRIRGDAAVHRRPERTAPNASCAPGVGRALRPYLPRGPGPDPALPGLALGRYHGCGINPLG